MISRSIVHLKRYFKGLSDITSKVKTKNKKNSIFIMTDILFCSIRYGTSPNDYYDLYFHELSNKKEVHM